MLSRKHGLCLCLCLLLIGTVAWAQRITGSLSGLVTDPQGLPVAKAKVTVANASINFRQELTTGNDGAFLLTDLRPATYQVTVEADGFKTLQTNVTVYVNSVATLSAQLELGETREVVVVESGVVTVDTTQHTVQGVVTGSQIDQLPLNGRNFLDLAQLQPGVQTVDGGTFDPTKNQMVGVSIGGRSGRVTRIQIDGVDITDETVGTTVANISNESIQEFAVAQSSLDVSTDVTSSGAVNIITRSGTNEIHGSGFFFWRDESFAADQRLAKSGPKPPFDREQGGGRAGGPFIKNRWFWHVEFEKTNIDSQTIVNIPEFPQFSGAFGVPVDENMGGVRTDYQFTQRWKGFYRYIHNDNFGVTGFGGRDLAAFSNRNNTNIHVAGVDFGGSRWTHQFRFSYLNFNNFIFPANDAAGTPNTLDPGGRPVLVRIVGVLQDAGPDLLAPQKTFQDNKQTKYDGGVIFGNHALRFGAEWNRIDQFVFAAFFGLAPRVLSRRNATTRAFANTNPFSSQGDLDPLNYPVQQIVLGNGLGFFSEKPALGFPFGGTTNDRLAFYLHDIWRVKDTFTLNFGLRYTYHTALSNHDLPRAPLIGLFDQRLVGRPRRDTDDFGPTAGFAWNVFGNNKLVVRGGAGIYYETNIFNNLLFDRVINIPPGIGFDVSVNTSGFPFVLDPVTGNVLFDFSTDCVGLPGNNCFNGSIGQVIPFAVQAQQLYQQASAAATANFPSGDPLFNATLDGTDLINPDYHTPYGAHMNIGFQWEIKTGLVLSTDYVRNRGVHFNLIHDWNRIGAADTLNIPIAQAAIAATLSDFGCSDIDCVISLGGTISDFADHGLGAGAGVDGFAFSGRNPNFRNMGVISPQGLSLFQALQVRLTGDVGAFEQFGIKRLFTNITYQLGRFESTGADQDFLSTAAFNDRPTQFFGPANLDRTHMLSVSFVADLPWNFTISMNNTFRSALANSLFLPATTGGADEIFFSDWDGDGVTQDPIFGSNRGSFSRDIKADDINNVISRWNSTFAGTLSPAARALVQAGLFTEAQLQALGAVLTSVQPAPAGQVNNDSFINTDLRISHRIRLTERWTVEPMVEVFNLFNVANYAAFGSGLDGNPGNANGTTASTRPTRVGQGTGSFAPGVQRAFQFGVRVNF